MKKFLLINPILILLVVQGLEHKYYGAALFSLLASVACVANLTSIATAANENRGKIVTALVLISLALFYFRL